jgi:hypothetical protein
VPRTRSTSVHQLKVVLRDTEVWRRLQVPSTITLARLHDVIQMAMGWDDYHLHDFEIDGVVYGSNDGEDWGTPVKEERRARLNAVAPAGTSIVYQYDFGDSWYHDIEVEEVLPTEAGQHYPLCLAGAGACPPEDCGGTWGYAELLEVLADPEHEEHESMLEWVGGAFDADRFDLAAVNETLSLIAAR